MMKAMRALLAALAVAGLTAGAAYAQSQAVNGTAYTSTQSAVTITTALTFQQVLGSSYTRRGCFIQNTSADVEYVYFGLTADATVAKSIKLNPGASLNCSSGVVLAGDAVQMTSATVNGATAVVVSQ